MNGKFYFFNHATVLSVSKLCRSHDTARAAKAERCGAFEARQFNVSRGTSALNLATLATVRQGIEGTQRVGRHAKLYNNANDVDVVLD